MALTPAQIKARGNRLTASRVGTLVNGSPEDIMKLWEEMIGEREPDDLSGVWMVQMGSATEVLNLAWYERVTGNPLTRHGAVFVHSDAKWAACTLDAWDDKLPGPVEAKHVGGFEPREKVVARYYPQVTWQMLCTGSSKAVLSIIEGLKEPALEEITLDPVFGASLLDRGHSFMKCVWALTPPADLPPVPAPVIVSEFKPYDMTGSNQWADHAVTWRETKTAAGSFDKATKGLKELVPADASIASGHGVSVKRDRAGRLSISGG